LILAPADGIVTSIQAHCALPSEIGGDAGIKSFTRVSTFLSVGDVHVNRIPVSGTVKISDYRPGAFVNASFDKASEQNERRAILIETPGGEPVAVVQIAGLIARRIVCDLAAGQTVHVGEKFGIIRFGSRVDVYFPDGTPLRILPGQRMVGGETVIAAFDPSGA